VSRPVAVVTGAGSGIGAAIARRLAPSHDLLATHLTDGPDIAHVADRVHARGGQFEVVFGDLTADDTIDRLGTAIHRHGPRLQALVCNAGAYPRIPWLQLTRQQLRHALDLHLHAHLACAHAATPHLIRHGDGRIVMISSVLTQIGRVDLTHYIAAKGALEAAAHALARELGPHHVTVNTIRAGSIEVPAEHTVVPDHHAMVTRQLARQCIPRRGHPDDVAAAVAYLISAEAGFITGQTLAVDGGWHLT
jgi:NAD(P)-dependent dehydrogenase (short-subunit alcohol dehydrogenase family)